MHRRKSPVPMLFLLVPLLAALAAPAPAPATSPAPSPLREIGHVEALSVCSALVVHANAAIGEALGSDAQIALAINRLRTTDLDTTNEIARRNGMSDLGTLAGRIRQTAAAGNAEIKRLRAMQSQTADPTRKAELKAFSDALSGALVRQRNAGVDLDRMLVIIDGRRAVEELNTTQAVDERAAIAQDPGTRARFAPASGILRSPVAGATPAPVNGILRGFAQEFTARTQAIMSDEGAAADHALGATTGC